MRTAVIILLSIISTAICAQERVIDNDPPEMQTLFGSRSGTGGFLGLSAKSTHINGEYALLTGGSVNMVIGHSFNLGLEGYGMATSVLSNRLDTAGDAYFMQLGYGGLNLEPVIASSNVIHLTVPVLLGIGGIGYTERHFWTEMPDGDIDIDFDHSPRQSRAFFVAEPGINLELNFLKWMRVAVGGSYRFTDQIHKTDPSTETIDGFSGNLSLRFGWF